MSTALAHDDALYRSDVRAAWSRYLAETRRHTDTGDTLGYELAEPNAWKRLKASLQQAKNELKMRRLSE